MIGRIFGKMLKNCRFRFNIGLKVGENVEKW